MAGGRPKGSPRVGGRVKGTPNLRTQELIDMVAASGQDPFAVMIDLLTNEDLHLRFQAAKELAQYLRPKRKAIEVTGDDGEPLLQAHPLTQEERLALVERARLVTK